MVSQKTSVCVLNPLHPKSDLYILLCLTPDDFTRQRKTPWDLKGLRNFEPLV